MLFFIYIKTNFGELCLQRAQLLLLCSSLLSFCRSLGEFVVTLYVGGSSFFSLSPKSLFENFSVSFLYKFARQLLLEHITSYVPINVK